MSGISRLGCAIGKGLLAGFAGTVAMTLSSTAEMRLRGRAASTAPPFWTWGAGEVAVDVWHHVVYATATGIVYESLR